MSQQVTILTIHNRNMTPLIGLHLGVWNKAKTSFLVWKSLTFSAKESADQLVHLTLEMIAVKELFIFPDGTATFIAWTLCPAVHEILPDKIEFWSNIAPVTDHKHLIVGKQSSVICMSNNPNHLKLLVSLSYWNGLTAVSTQEAYWKMHAETLDLTHIMCQCIVFLYCCCSRALFCFFLAAWIETICNRFIWLSVILPCSLLLCLFVLFFLLHLFVLLFCVVVVLLV